MLKITSEMFSEVLMPPAIIMQIKDFAIARIQLPDQDDFVGVVLELQHPEVPRSFRQLYHLPLHLLADFADQLEAHVISFGGTHDF
jgi:hypothetical protein